MQWWAPVIKTLRDAEARGSLEPTSWSPAKATYQDAILKGEKKTGDWAGGGISVEEDLLSICEALDSIPQHQKAKTNQTKFLKENLNDG